MKPEPYRPPKGVDEVVDTKNSVQVSQPSEKRINALGNLLMKNAAFAAHIWRGIVKEWPLALGIASSFAFGIGGESLMSTLMPSRGVYGAFAILFIAILAASFAVVRHGECLAHRLGEPLGTLILTLSVTVIEVANLSAVMLHGGSNPTLVRETLFSVLMIVLNGMIGLSLLIGGWIHREQDYSLRGANAYLGVIVPLAVLTLVVPNFTETTAGPTLSANQQVFLGIISTGMYGTFLFLQTGRHRELFREGSSNSHAEESVESSPLHSTLYHTIMLLLYLALVVYKAELLAHPIDEFIETRHAPTALGGLIIALLVASPEGLGAIRAALANQMQRAMNITLGSVLSTIGLTVPAMLIVATVTDRSLLFGLQHTDIVMLILTLFSAALTFASGRTNVLQGLMHLILFVTYLFFIWQR